MISLKNKKNTKIIKENNEIIIRLYNTNICIIQPDRIILNHGNYKSHTTKTRMNQVSKEFHLGFYVYQKDFYWFVDYKNETYKFFDSTISLKK